MVNPVRDLIKMTATIDELDRHNDVSSRLVAGGATLTLTQALHDGKTVLFDSLAGTEFTLPAAVGSGMKLRFVVSVKATSSNHKISCVGTDEFNGSIETIDTDTNDAVVTFAAEVGDDFDVITFNRSTTGLGNIGDWIELEDIVAGVWACTGVIGISGNSSQPFSST